MNSCLIEEDGTESVCSSLFEGIHPAFTIAQAGIAMVIIVVGGSLNVLFIVALITFRHRVNEGFILCLSIFIANLILSVVFGINIFVASSTRSWPLGYRGCQFFGFVTYLVTTVRWVTLGMLSVDRFCRVFLPLCYSRHSKTVLKVLFLFPWVILLPTAILPLFNINGTYNFFNGFLGCYYQQKCTETSVCPITIYVTFTVVLASGSVLPIVLYTIIYCKARRLLRVMRSHHANSEQQMEDNEMQNKATKTFALMVITYTCYTSIIVAIKILVSFPATKGITELYLFLGDILFLYIFTDFLLAWKNKQGKSVIKKLIDTVLQKQICGSDPPSSTHTSIQHITVITTSSVN